VLGNGSIHLLKAISRRHPETIRRQQRLEPIDHQLPQNKELDRRHPESIRHQQLELIDHQLPQNKDDEILIRIKVLDRRHPESIRHQQLELIDHQLPQNKDDKILIRIKVLDRRIRGTILLRPEAIEIGPERLSKKVGILKSAEKLQPRPTAKRPRLEDQQ
jgi:hypothetical protein